jgi:fructose-specific phosphotransferase system IIA component
MTDQEFLNLFDEDLFIFDLQAKDKEGVLREFTDKLRSTERISDQEIILDMLLRRESLGSTALRDGVAIPHGRTLTTRRLIVAFGRCKEGLEFGAHDGKPVHLFFLIIAPDRGKGERYLQTLKKVSQFCQRKEVREKLLNVTNFREFQDVFLGEMGLQ